MNFGKCYLGSTLIANNSSGEGSVQKASPALVLYPKITSDTTITNKDIMDVDQIEVYPKEANSGSLKERYKGWPIYEVNLESLMYGGSISDLTNTFNGCISLTDVTFGNVDFNTNAILTGCFLGCTALNSCDINNIKWSYLKDAA